MKLNKWILAGTALTGAFAAHSALAQSTASQEVEQVTEVVVTGQRNIGDTKRESGAKAKATIGQETLLRATPGQTFVESLNSVPGFKFENNDAYGMSGGEIMMRGLNSERISLTIDGIQINDSGNYALYPHQLVDTELLCSASVSTGATDIDSISASATGGTVNTTTCLPSQTFGGVVKVAGGDDDFKSIFVKADTGAFGPFGTRAYVAYTGSHVNTWTKETPDNLRLQKNQWNAMLYQNIGDNGSFISVSANWNENRNHFINTQSKLQIAQRGYGVSTNTLANVNPSDTGNIRIKSKWVLTDKLTLTVDPSFQYVMALGGSNSTISESSVQLLGATYNGVPNSQYVDINKNGVRDTSVAIYRPNITNTHRYALQSGLIYRVSDNHLLRFNASLDRANHRQTGEATLTDANGAPIDLFAGKENKSLRIKTADGTHFRRRDRQSYADADIFSFEYIGRFFDEKMVLNVGVRDQTLTRELNQYCYSPIGVNASINPYCSTQKVLTSTNTTDPNIKIVTLDGSPLTNGQPTQYITPYQRTVEISKTLPNVGVTWRFENGGQLFATYAESLSSPRTDALYDVVVRNNTVVTRNPAPETAETVEVGYRFNKPNFNGSLTLFNATDQNRLVEAFVQDTAGDFGYSTFTNVGEVKRNGVEAAANYRPVNNLTFSASMTYTDTELQEDIENGFTAVSSGGVRRLLPTKGKALTGMPKWMWTVGMNYDITQDFNLNLSGKYVGDRFYTFVNDEVAPRYFVWNASARYDLPWMKEGTYLQLNVVNLFDEQYLFGTGYQNNSVAFRDNTNTNVSGSTVFYQQGAPRSVVLTLRTQF